MAEIRLDEVSKRFPDGTTAVDSVSLEIADGEFVVLVGPSGCGKTTLLRSVAGLERVSDGAITIGGRDVTAVDPKDRDIAMVFQDYALYPHMTVEANIAFGLKLRRRPKAEIRGLVAEVARVLELEPLLRRRPAQLSGGQRQRVAMARAMVREPSAFLMDEPLSNLDAKLRVQMRAEIARMRDRLRTTTIYVTHDQVEAMTLGDRVAVLRDGRLQQVDRPHVLFDRPRNLFVAAFIGSPAMNVVAATIGEGKVRFAGFELPLPARDDLKDYEGKPVLLGIRPSTFEDAELAATRLPVVEVRLEIVEDLGSELQVLFSIDAPPVADDALAAAAEEAAEPSAATGAHRNIFTARLHSASRAVPHAPFGLAVDPEAFHFFDPRTREAIGAPVRPRGGVATVSGSAAASPGAD